MTDEGRYESAGGEAKRIVLVGDSIRMGYAPEVILLLGGQEVFSHPINAGSTKEILAHFDEWIVNYRPDIVHINAGIHDVKRVPTITSDHVTLPAEYANNVRTILTRIRNETGATIIWGTSTPVMNPQFNSSPAAAERGSYIFNDELVEYNKIALDVVEKLGGISVDELYSQVVRENTASIHDDTHIHYTLIP